MMMVSSVDMLVETLINGGDQKSPSFKNDLELSDIKDNLQIILSYVFDIEVKQEIDDLSNRFAFSCPYCHDSSKSFSKKRGNLYFDSLMFHCFNCGAHKSLYYFFKDFQQYLKSDSLDVYKRVHSVTREQNKYNIIDNSIEGLSIKQSTIEDKLRFTKIDDRTRAYLIKRLQTNFDLFGFCPKYNALVIYNKDFNDNVIGFTLRTLKKNADRKYTLYNLKKIYELMELKIPEDIDKFGQISTIFNVLRVNLDQIVTVFEGPLDSFLYSNSLATSGITKRLPFDIDNIRYWFDNDVAGKKKSIEFINNGSSVFLWKKLFLEYEIPKEIKDLNSLMIYGNKNDIKFKNFNKYFSNGKLDAYYV